MSSGNLERDAMLKRAIGECAALGDALVIGNVSDKLPGDFFGMMDPEADAELAAALHEMGLAPADPLALPTPQPEPVVTEVEPEARISREQAQHAVDASRTRLDNARIAVKVAQENCHVARDKLAKATIAWQEQGEPLSNAERQQREVRNHLASEAANRAARGAPHSGAARFVQKHMRNGPNRGAFSMQQAARFGFKVPSQG